MTKQIHILKIFDFTNLFLVSNHFFSKLKKNNNYKKELIISSSSNGIWCFKQILLTNLFFINNIKNFLFSKYSSITSITFLLGHQLLLQVIDLQHKHF